MFKLARPGGRLGFSGKMEFRQTDVGHNPATIFKEGSCEARPSRKLAAIKKIVKQRDFAQ